MIEKSSLRVKGITFACVLNVAAVGLNVREEFVEPSDDNSFGTFLVERTATGSAASANDAIAVQHTIDGKIIIGRSPAREYQVSFRLTDQSSGSWILEISNTIKTPRERAHGAERASGQGWLLDTAD